LNSLGHPALRDKGRQRDVESVGVQRSYIIIQNYFGARGKLGL